jgi:hypothetical protein
MKPATDFLTHYWVANARANCILWITEELKAALDAEYDPDDAWSNEWHRCMQSGIVKIDTFTQYEHPNNWGVRIAPKVQEPQNWDDLETVTD